MEEIEKLLFQVLFFEHGLLSNTNNFRELLLRFVLREACLKVLIQVLVSFL